MKPNKLIGVISGIVIIAAGLVWLVDFNKKTPATEPSANSETTMVTGDSLEYDAHSGLVKGDGLSLILSNCSTCHTTDLIKNNRFTRDGWLAKIRWMQNEQNLWDLGENEQPILDYLEKYYSPSTSAARAHLRREPLSNIQWYEY